MRLWVVLLLIGGCGFRVGGEAVDSGPPEGDAGFADALDPECHVGTGPAASATGTVGLSTGGGTANGGATVTLGCSAPEVAVGLAYEISNSNVLSSTSRSALAVRLACADLTIDKGGPHLSTPSELDATGAGGFGWTPATWTPVAMCAPGSVVTRIGQHSGKTGTDMSFYLDTEMSCTAVDALGHDGAISDVPIADPTKGMGISPSQMVCPTGTQVSSVVVNTGAGLDSMIVSCAPTICQ